MVEYKTFSYIYPPRPENKITPDQLDVWQAKGYFAQPKLNGSCCLLFMKDNKVRNFGRHKNEDLKGKGAKDSFSLTADQLNFLNPFPDEWMVLVGEYMNKSQNYSDGKPWNHKFVIFDILVYKGEYLVGTTFEFRKNLLDELYGQVEYDDFLYKISNDVFRVKTFYNFFKATWDKLVTIDMFEGLVLKKIDGKLERGTREANNVGTQVKCRKPTKNYTH